ncbi:GNAT family N-acetyltransferase [Microbacterium lacus]|uniref:GNAT family N-acetyltransferase n=1 Tax=Microbacterium lacus TaxID=415217 RepID=UPI00384D2B83
MNFVIREPSPADAAAIAALNVSTWRETYSHLLPDGFFSPEFAQNRRDMWNHVLANPHPERTVRVAEVDGELVGFGFAGPSFGAEGEVLPRDRHLYSLYVSGSQHGTGVGQALFDAVLHDEPAMLWVATENPRAIAFYERNGFAFDGREQVDPLAPGIVEARMIR